MRPLQRNLPVFLLIILWNELVNKHISLVDAFRTNLLSQHLVTTSVYRQRKFFEVSNLSNDLKQTVSLNNRTPQWALQSTTASSTPITSQVAASQALDWSFLDAVYLITCPNADPESKRLTRALEILEQIGLRDRVQVRKFDTDDENRVRGCYTSHISVLKNAVDEFGLMGMTERLSKSPLEELFFTTWIPRRPTDRSVPIITGGRRRAGKRKNLRLLVLEDNFALSHSLQQNLLDALAQFATNSGGTPWSVIHLSYNPYVPALQVTKTESANIVKLNCGIGSALGTTGYIINEVGMETLIQHDRERGFYAAIPDVMAELFPETRFAPNPTIFVRAPRTKSLVNPQLDELREVLFQPIVATQAQRLLVLTGWTTNTLLPVAVVLLLIATAASAKSSFDAAWCIFTNQSLQGPILLPVLCTAFTAFSLAIIYQGFVLAPKPTSNPEALEDKLRS